MMKPQPHPPAVRTAAGNLVERAAQIQRIKERLDRIGGSAHQVAAELVVLAQEVKAITASRDAPAPAAVPSRRQDN